MANGTVDTPSGSIFLFGVKITKASAMLGIGQDFVAHHPKASALAGLTSVSAIHSGKPLSGGRSDGFVALSALTAAGLTTEAHKTISFPFHFEEARFALIVSGVRWRVMAGKPLVLASCKLFLLFGLDQLFKRVASQRHVSGIVIHFQILKVLPIQVGVVAMVIEFQHAEFGVGEHEETNLDGQVTIDPLLVHL